MNNNEFKGNKTKNDNKQEDIDKKNKEILDELQKLEAELHEDLDIKTLNEALNNGPRLDIKKSILSIIVGFLMVFLGSFLACYIAYGVIYNQICITRLNALWLNLSIAFILALFQSFFMKCSFVGKICNLIFIYGVLIIGMCTLSNLGIIFEIKAFRYILLYFIVEFLVFEMYGYLLTRCQLERIVR